MRIERPDTSIPSSFTDLTITNDLNVQNDLDVDNDLNVDGAINVNGLVSDDAGALTLGTDASTGHSLGTGDVLIGGDLEIDGATYFDGDIILSDGTILAAEGSEGNIILSNAAKDQGILLDTTTDGELHVKDESDAYAYVVADRLLWNSGGAYLSGSQMSLGSNHFTIATNTSSGYSRNLSVGTGNSNGSSDLVSGTLTLYTGDTDTDGDTGDIDIYTGVAGAGQADAGDITLSVHGAPGAGETAITIEGATGNVIMANLPTADSGLTAGTLWSDGGTLKVSSGS